MWRPETPVFTVASLFRFLLLHLKSWSRWLMVQTYFQPASQYKRSKTLYAWALVQVIQIVPSLAALRLVTPPGRFPLFVFVFCCQNLIVVWICSHRQLTFNLMVTTSSMSTLLLANPTIAPNAVNQKSIWRVAKGLLKLGQRRLPPSAFKHPSVFLLLWLSLITLLLILSSGYLLSLLLRLHSEE